MHGADALREAGVPSVTEQWPQTEDHATPAWGRRSFASVCFKNAGDRVKAIAGDGLVPDLAPKLQRQPREQVKGLSEIPGLSARDNVRFTFLVVLDGIAGQGRTVDRELGCG